jgi:hypothetical protein
MEAKKDKSRVITATIKESYIERLEKIMSNYTKNGKHYTFSGAIDRILKLGFRKFEELNKVTIDDLEIKKQEDLDEEES